MTDETTQWLQHTLQREPFCHIKKTASGFIVSGSASHTLGHKVTARGARPKEGVFGQWHWDGRTLHAHVDECGFYPLYYYVTETECAVSPSIPALLLLGAPPQLDHKALAVFLRLGWFLGSDTPFALVRAFQPGGTLRWTDGQIEVTSAFPQARESHLSRTQGIDGYIDLFRASLQRRLPDTDNFTVLLTGGRDSRHQLFELTRAGHKPQTAYSIGEYIVASNEEMAAASAIAKAVGVNHVIVNQTESPFVLERKNNFFTNFCADEHSWLWVLADRLRGKYQIIYDGLGGSIFDRGFLLTEHRLALCDAGRFEELAVDLFSREDVLPVFSSSIKDHCSRELAIAHLTQELQLYRNDPNPIDSFLFWTRTRRESALSSYRVLDSAHRVICPFIDLELVNHLASLPGSMMLDHNFHDETIHRAFPQYAHIPFGPKGGPLRMPYDKARQLTWEFSKYMFSMAPGPSINYGHLLPRMGRCLVDPSYSPAISWMGLTALYMLQLDHLPEQIARVRSGELPLPTQDLCHSA